VTFPGAPSIDNQKPPNIGIYGVMAFQVARRWREIGIRMALGADVGAVSGMVLDQTARLTLAGCAIGVSGGLALTRVATAHPIRHPPG